MLLTFPDDKRLDPQKEIKAWLKLSRKYLSKRALSDWKSFNASLKKSQARNIVWALRDALGDIAVALDDLRKEEEKWQKIR
ncbi:hypothetical protein ACFLQ1_02545 [Candidatus Auribacterota bacterium]